MCDSGTNPMTCNMQQEFDTYKAINIGLICANVGHDTLRLVSPVVI